MQRDIDKDLQEWKNHPNRSPIILRGARQIGKTYVVRSFAAANFSNYVEVNFELDPKFKTSFDSLDPLKILPQLEIQTGKRIIPGDTLLFFDEIQECPRALMALRYFKENLPSLHVIAAGSLLEFVFHEPDFRMPVGRVQLFHMKPLSFKEFLVAIGREQLRKFLENVQLGDEIPESVHQQALEHIREYCILGGMPAVINEYLNSHSFAAAQDVQSHLLVTYQNDFGKYTQGSLTNYCRLLFTKAPELVTKQFKFVHVSEEVQSRELKPALMKLVQAGVLHLVYGTSAGGLPLNALLNEKKMKLLFLDVGLMKRAGHLETETVLRKDLLLVNQGQLVEQFVGQELLAYQDLYLPPEIYFWARDSKGSTAEVDFVVNLGSQIIPIEVKSGGSHKIKSLKILLEEQRLTRAVKISAEVFSRFSSGENQEIFCFPLYLIGELGRLLS